MSFQAYLDTIKAKTGKSPEDFKALAEEKGLKEYRPLVAWLKSEYGLGQGHANAMAHVILGTFESKPPADERVAKHFSGPREKWRRPFETLMEYVRGFGDDVRLAPTDSYISLLRKDKKFGVVQATGKQLDIGIKLKEAPAQGRFGEARSWNAMVTHRVQIEDASQVDEEVIDWLRQAYERA